MTKGQSPCHKNQENLLNIAGTGPILGPIQGILFGPIAFFTIPIGCVIGGAVHDYLAAVTIWFMKNDRKKQVWIPMIPLVFYSYIISGYIVSAPIGFSLPLSWASVIGMVFTVAVVAAVVYKGGRKQI